MAETQKFYLYMNCFSIFYARFAFLDTSDYLADRLFAKHQVRVRFGREFVNPSSEYRVITCKVRKKDVPQFQAALAELPNKMLLLGHYDYLEESQKLWSEVENQQKGAVPHDAESLTE